MALGAKFDMLPEMNTRATLFDDRVRAQKGNLENGLRNELGLQYQNYDRNERERDLNMYRSGSAPPTIEGSYNALSSLFRNLDFPNGGFSEEEMRSHPAYLSYYYSHDNNINPRLPPPLLSKEEWRMHQRLRSGGLPYGEVPAWRKRGLVDERADCSSLFSVQPALSLQKEKNGIIDHSVMSFTNTSRQASSPWLDNRDHELVRHGGGGLGVRRKSLADILQEGSNRSTGPSGPIPRQANRNASYDFLDSCNSNIQPPELWNGLEAKEGLYSGAAPNLGRVQSHHSLASGSFPTAVGSTFSRSSTPEFQRISGSPTPNLPSKDRFFPSKVNNIAGSYVTNGKSSSMNSLSDFVAGLSLAGLEHSENGLGDRERPVNSHFLEGQPYQVNFQPNMPISQQQQQLFGRSTGQRLVTPTDYPSSKPPVNLPSKANSTRIRDFNEQNSYNKTRTPVVPKHGPGGHSNNQNFNTGADNPLGSGGQFNGRWGNNMQLDYHYQPTDPADFQYYRHPANQNLLVGGKFISASHRELSEVQKAHLDALLSRQQRYGLPLLQKSHSGVNDGYYEGLAYLLGMPYQGASIANSLSDIRFGNSMLQCDIPASMKGMAGMSLLEEFKNKTRPFELSDIVGHVVEFSMDQCGSRFIQQKLEIATNEEKMKVFPEIAPHARALMTDVFGNYVIQKFFERGAESQRNILADKMKSHVLQLSLQMYGCRVIQKALETLEVDEKGRLVVELDGSVLKCVRDQNGNHVIQKCIECIPEERIQFIISSFFGQVVSLSTHPYGCRVIQRVLEHSSSLDTQKRIMEEIMQSICTLAQDQYGNYAVQHVIQHGKPEERSIIIKKLAGQIVQMSQQKFSSNVIEKCLTFGSPEERQVLVNEMLGSTDVNEPLQDMMKDPFGNYVVQKVLETCDERTRELILSRIKLHLCDLKKYTYVKHVVSRVEKLLITAGGLYVVHNPFFSFAQALTPFCS